MARGEKGTKSGKSTYTPPKESKVLNISTGKVSRESEWYGGKTKTPLSPNELAKLGVARAKTAQANKSSSSKSKYTTSKPKYTTAKSKTDTQAHVKGHGGEHWVTVNGRHRLVKD